MLAFAGMTKAGAHLDSPRLSAGLHQGSAASLRTESLRYLDCLGFSCHNRMFSRGCARRGAVFFSRSPVLPARIDRPRRFGLGAGAPRSASGRGGDVSVGARGGVRGRHTSEYALIFDIPQAIILIFTTRDAFSALDGLDPPSRLAGTERRSSTSGKASAARMPSAMRRTLRGIDDDLASKGHGFEIERGDIGHERRHMRSPRFVRSAASWRRGAFASDDPKSQVDLPRQRPLSGPANDVENDFRRTSRHLVSRGRHRAQ